MRDPDQHTETDAVAAALRAALPVPSRIRVYTFTCGCPDADGQLFWTVDTESRSYELVVATDTLPLREVGLTRTPRFGDGDTGETHFLIRSATSRWPEELAQFVGRLTLSDHSPLSLH